MLKVIEMADNFENKQWVDGLKRTKPVGRPFLHEQGSWVTRGFVVQISFTDDAWALMVRDVEYLDKSSGQWSKDINQDVYGGPLSRTSFSFESPDPSQDFNHPFDVSCDGLYIYIGIVSKSPWADNDWPELDTDCLKPGPMTV